MDCLITKDAGETGYVASDDIADLDIFIRFKGRGTNS